jgi:hypothetical protein
MALGLIGAGIGAVGGAVGGILNAREQKKQREQLQRQTSEGILTATAEAKQQARAVVGTDEYQAVLNLGRDVFGLGAVTGEDTFALGGVREKYKNVLPASKLGTTKFSSVEDQFRKNFTQAQVSRGIYDSNIAASAEASGMAAWRFQQQKEMAPLMMDLASRPTELFNKYMEPTAKRHIMFRTGGAAEYRQNQQLTGAILGGESVAGAGFAGAVGGALQGFNLGQQLQNFGVQQQSSGANNLLQALQVNQALGDQGQNPLYDDEYLNRLRQQAVSGTNPIWG